MDNYKTELKMEDGNALIVLNFKDGNTVEVLCSHSFRGSTLHYDFASFASSEPAVARALVKHFITEVEKC